MPDYNTGSTAYLKYKHATNRTIPWETCERVMESLFAELVTDDEAQFIRDGLERHGWHREATARDLGIHKATLFKKIRKLGIELPEVDGRSRRSGGEP